MSLKAIVSRLGGELYDGGRRASIPAPGHSPADRSVSLRQEGARILVHCFAGSDWREVRDQLRGLGLLSVTTAEIDIPPVRAIAPPPDAVARRAAAVRIWETGRPLDRSLSARHCRLRGVDGPLPGPDALRHGPSTPFSAYRQVGRRGPALLAAIRDPQGELSAVEITYLNPGGRRDRRMMLSRKTIGVVPSGSAIRLAAPGRAMLVAEGVFTSLAAMRRFGLPGWALCSAVNFKRWRAPDGVEAVLIAADRGAVGEAAAQHLSSGLQDQGLDVEIVIPPEPFGDWDEAVGADGLLKGRTKGG